MKEHFSAQDIVFDDDNYIRSMRRLHATGGTNTAHGLDNLFEATGWHLNLNEGRHWDVHCYNNTPNDYVVVRCKPFTNYWEIVSKIRVPAHSADLTIESFQPDNEDQWWVAIVVNADGRQETCNGEPGGSDAVFAPDSRSALFGWHQPSEFQIRVQAQ